MEKERTNWPVEGSNGRRCTSAARQDSRAKGPRTSVGRPNTDTADGPVGRRAAVMYSLVTVQPRYGTRHSDPPQEGRSAFDSQECDMNGDDLRDIGTK